MSKWNLEPRSPWPGIVSGLLELAFVFVLGFMLGAAMMYRAECTEPPTPQGAYYLVEGSQRAER